MAKQVFTNNASAVLTTAVNTGVTSLILDDASKFPSPTAGDYFLAALIGLNVNGQEASWEIVKCTARATNTLTVVRAQEGTTAASWGIGARIEVRLTAAFANGATAFMEAPTIVGGSINSSPIGATTPSTGAFTTLSASGNAAIGTTPGSAALSIQKGAGVSALVEISGNNNSLGTTSVLVGQDSSNLGYLWNRANAALTFGTSNTEVARFDTSGNLGLGVTPSAWGTQFDALDFGAGAGYTATTSIASAYDASYFTNNAYYTDVGGAFKYVSSKHASQYQQIGGAHVWYTAPSGTAGNPITFTQAMTLDASGNLGIGVTPSAWNSGVKALQIANGGQVSFAGAYGVVGQTNAYYNASSQYIYTAAGVAANYSQEAGAHIWRTAPSGTAGNPITFTQAMTLDASGNLLVPAAYSVTTASAANCFVETTGQFKRSTSSLKYKTDVETLRTSYADGIYQMRPVWYRSKCEGDNAGWSWYGLIAEEVAEIDPRLVHWAYPMKTVEDHPETEAIPAVLDDDGAEIEPAIPAREATTKQVKDTDAAPVAEGMQYERLTVLLIDVVQRQKQAIEALEARLSVLEAA